MTGDLKHSTWEKTIRFARLIPLLLPAGCAAMMGGPSPERVAEKAAFRVVGPVDDVPVNTVRQARVLDDHTIDFVMSDGGRLRAALTSGCLGLTKSSSFVYDRNVTGRLGEGTEVSFSVAPYGNIGEGAGGYAGRKVCAVSSLVRVVSA